MTVDGNDEYGPRTPVAREHPAHTFRVFYDPATGRIDGYEFTNVPQTRAGLDYLDFDHAVECRHPTYKVDLATGTIVEATEAEKHEAMLPAEYEVKAAILKELEATDSLFAPGRPLKDADAWLAYRQELRDLSKRGFNHLDQLRAWPERPDGMAPTAAALITRL
jgi:hypothetical protein